MGKVVPLRAGKWTFQHDVGTAARYQVYCDDAGINFLALVCGEGLNLDGVLGMTLLSTGCDDSSQFSKGPVLGRASLRWRSSTSWMGRHRWARPMQGRGP